MKLSCAITALVLFVGLVFLPTPRERGQWLEGKVALRQVVYPHVRF